MQFSFCIEDGRYKRVPTLGMRLTARERTSPTRVPRKSWQDHVIGRVGIRKPVAVGPAGYLRSPVVSLFTDSLPCPAHHAAQRRIPSPVLPLAPDSQVRAGHPNDPCCFRHGVVYPVRTRIPWRDLPARCGHWNSVYRRWCQAGVRARMPTAVAEARANPSRVPRASSHKCSHARGSGAATGVAMALGCASWRTGPAAPTRCGASLSSRGQTDDSRSAPRQGANRPRPGAQHRGPPPCRRVASDLMGDRLCRRARDVPVHLPADPVGGRAHALGLPERPSVSDRCTQSGRQNKQ